ncbi:MAG: cation:proton antiporter [Halanaerobiales bacterium]
MELFNSFILTGGLFLLLFAGIDYLSHKLKFSSIIFILILGIISGFFMEEFNALHTIAEIGIILLFFLLGLEFPLKRMMDIFKRSWAAGLIDILLNIFISLLISLTFNLDLITSFFIGAIVYASSSSITLKLLEEKKRMANKETEFILALLIFEDLVAPIMVSFFAGIYQGENFSLSFISTLLIQIVLLTVGAILVGHFVFRHMSSFIEKHLDKEFIPLFTIGVAFSYAGLALYLGLSEVLGAFLAGIMLSETGKASDLEYLILPVRNITLPFFYFWFGSTIYLEKGITWPGLLLVLVIWSIIAKFLVSYTGGQIFGLSRKVAIRGGFSLVQRGEFSAIIAALAPVTLRTFAGIYILITAFIGIIFFNMAPEWSKKLSVILKNHLT